MSCVYCEESPRSGTICTACLAKLGLTEPAEPVRRALPCARCNHPETIRALAREFTTSPGEVGEREAVPMGVTIEPEGMTTFFTGRRKGVQNPRPSTVIGLLEMYICAKCGLTEWYCRDPDKLPIGPQYGTSKISADGEGPYR